MYKRQLYFSARFAISSRRFFELDHEILHTYSGRHYLKLEEGGFLIFCLGGRLFGVPAGVLDPGGGSKPGYLDSETQIKNPPSSSFRYCLPEYVCKISWSNSKKRREEFPGTQFWAFNLNQPVRCLRFRKLSWVGKHINIIMKATNSPTQGQPNPRTSRLKVAFGPLFPTANNFSWVGIDLHRKQTTRTRNPTQPNSPQARVLLSCVLLSCMLLSCMLLSCILLSCVLLSCILLSCILLSCILLSCILLSCILLAIHPSPLHGPRR